jgi:hypothetical protein
MWLRTHSFSSKLSPATMAFLYSLRNWCQAFGANGTDNGNPPTPRIARPPPHIENVVIIHCHGFGSRAKTIQT